MLLSCIVQLTHAMTVAFVVSPFERPNMSCSAQDRLDAQKAERASKGAAYDKDFKPQATKDEKGVRRKEIVANIGECRAHCRQDLGPRVELPGLDPKS